MNEQMVTRRRAEFGTRKPGFSSGSAVTDCLCNPYMFLILSVEGAIRHSNNCTIWGIPVREVGGHGYLD